MLIATFGPTTAWSGKTITRNGDAFVLEDHGSITAVDVMEYDRQGHLLWVNDGARAWVGSKARSRQAANAVAAITTTTPGGGEAPVATTGEGKYVKRALLVTIGVLIVANVVLILTLLGVFRGL